MGGWWLTLWGEREREPGAAGAGTPTRLAVAEQLAMYIEVFQQLNYCSLKGSVNGRGRPFGASRAAYVPNVNSVLSVLVIDRCGMPFCLLR